MAVPAVVLTMNKMQDVKSKAEVTKKDVLNVLYTLNNKRLDDQFSFSSPLSMWDVSDEIMPLKDNILFHKSAGETCPDMPELEVDDFLLCLMTPKQILSIHKYVDSGLCIEVTRGSNQGNDLTLITLMSYDFVKHEPLGKCEDVPLAWCISNVDAPRIKRSFFCLIYEKCEYLCTPILMTNEWSECYEAWINFFEVPGSRIVSPWAVQAVIEAAVKRFVVGSSRHTKLIRDLQLLLTSPMTLDSLQNQIDALLLGHVEYHKFAEYFRTKFTDNPDGGWSAAHYPEHLEGVKNFLQVATDLAPKLRAFANKKVGRCVHMVMRHYVTKLHHMDSTFIRKRKRGKVDDPRNLPPVIDDIEMKREAVRALLTNLKNLATAGVRPKSQQFVKDKLKNMYALSDGHTCNSNQIKARESNLKRKRYEQKALLEKLKVEKKRESKTKKHILELANNFPDSINRSNGGYEGNLVSIPRINFSKHVNSHSATPFITKGVPPPRSIYSTKTENDCAEDFFLSVDGALSGLESNVKMEPQEFETSRKEFSINLVIDTNFEKPLIISFQG